MEDIISRVALPGRVASCDPWGNGHLNRTFRLTLADGSHYILQSVSSTAFHDIPGLMDNFSAVTKVLTEQSDDPRACLHLIPTKDGRDYFTDRYGEYWRMLDFVEGSVCLQSPESPEDFYQSAVAFGNFQRMLRGFPAETLCETIPHFHDTPDRYRKLHAAIDADEYDRVQTAQREIDFALAREADAGVLQRMRDDGTLPLRVTHNDTKLNNVMLDEKTRKALCVIDLDTVMPGLAAYDFGDAIRFGASTAAEDEKDLSKVQLDLTMFRAFAGGFIPACGGLTDAELHSLPLGAKIITLECGVRFLTDYLMGDEYFSIAYNGHNLDRARTQFALAADIEAKWDDILAIMREVTGK